MCVRVASHKVIVITHSHGERQGVRFMSGGLKCYYLCHRAIYNGASLPTFGLNLLPVVRQILLRERIDVVHAHQAFSNIGHEWCGALPRRLAPSATVCAHRSVRTTVYCLRARSVCARALPTTRSSALPTRAAFS